MDKLNQAVNQEEAAPSELDVNNQTPEATDAVSSEQEQTEQLQEQEEVQHIAQDVDEHGVPWKNRAMEIQRKYDETVSNLPKIVEETVAKATAKPTERKYTIEELEQIALTNPQLRPQVEAEKAKLIEERITRKNEEFVQGLETKKQAEVQKYQSEQWVLNHPKFKECFIDSPNGKQWNLNNPLTQVIQRTLSNPEIKNRPDALAVAARVAYGDYMLSSEPKAKAQLKTLQKTVRTEQKKTLVEGGGGNQNTSIPGDPLKAAQENLRKTGSRTSAEAAVKEHLKKMGLVT